MYPLYEDITNRLGEPLWYDQHGVPRYDKFEPTMCSIYADYGALSVIRCQSCGREFKIGVSWSAGEATVRNLGNGKKILEDGSSIACGIHWDKNGQNGKPVSFPSEKDLGEFGYGDAPWHTLDGNQCPGTTMTTEDVACLEFWHRSMKQDSEEFMEWVRMPEYEVSMVVPK